MAGPPEKNAYLRANRTHTLGTYGALLHLVDGWHADADPSFQSIRSPRPTRRMPLPHAG